MRLVTARKIIPMGGPDPQALAIRGEWIAASGTLADLREQFPAAEVRDFGSATLVPGFNDAHQHPTICAEQALQVDLSPHKVASKQELVAALRERASATPAGDWVIGCGYDHARSTGGVEITCADLDEACPGHPVLVVHVTLHAGVLNSRGLELAGLDGDSEPPPGGELGRDASGRLTGVVHDQALYDIAFPAFTRRQTIVPQAGTAERMEALRGYIRRLNAAGITSVGDALIGPDEWRLLQHADRQNLLDVRVNALVAYEHFDHFRPLTDQPVGPLDRLRLGGVKAFADGAVNGGTCLVEEPIEGTDSHGIARVSPAELDDIVEDVHGSGWRIGVHANGDRAIRRVLDAIEKAQAVDGRSEVRHRIEHCSIIDEEILDRMRRDGVVAVPFANYVAAHGDKLIRYYGRHRSERMFAHRSLLDAGVAVAGSSDYPCGPYEPLFALQSCVTRCSGDGSQFGASQAITAREALALYTTGSAFASGEESTKGRLTPGHLADLVVLQEDPLTVDPDHLAEIPVRETWVGGAPVWSAG